MNYKIMILCLLVGNAVVSDENLQIELVSRPNVQPGVLSSLKDCCGSREGFHHWCQQPCCGNTYCCCGDTRCKAFKLAGGVVGGVVGGYAAIVGASALITNWTLGNFSSSRQLRGSFAEYMDR